MKAEPEKLEEAFGLGPCGKGSTGVNLEVKGSKCKLFLLSL